MISGAHKTQDELAFYAMQSLPVEDSASISQHLQTCLQCRTALAQISGDLALFGLALDQQPRTLIAVGDQTFAEDAALTGF